MEFRDEIVLKMRLTLANVSITNNTSIEERFQNETLRPILKMQNDLFLLAFRNYIIKYKSVFYQLTLPKRLIYIEHAIQKDIKFRNSLKGMVIGHFTSVEYNTYVQNSSALNKRMMTMLIERLKDQVQYFESPMLSE